MEVPDYAEVVAAREFISPYLPKTPLVRSHKLSEALGCDYYLKLENLQPVGAFKVRGGVNLVSQLSNDERRAGVDQAAGVLGVQAADRGGHYRASRRFGPVEYVAVMIPRPGQAGDAVAVLTEAAA